MISEKGLRALAEKILKQLDVRGATLDVFLLPDREIAAIKARFIKKKTEPNVLAFPEPARFPHPETKKRHLGEVYLNRGILKEAPARAAPLLLHGILHLLGYDHTKAGDAKKMERLENGLLARLPQVARRRHF